MKTIIDRTLQHAKDLGVDNLDVIYSSQDSFSLKAEKSELSEYKKANSHSVGVRVIMDERVGVSFTELADDDSIKKIIENAKENSKFGKVNKFESICSQGRSILDEQEKNNCKDWPSPEEMIEKALYLEQGVLEKDKLATSAPYNSLTQAKINFIVGNSLGQICEHKSSYYSCFTSALLKDGQKNSMHYYGDISRNFKTLNFDKCIDESVFMAKNLLNAEQIKTGKYDVSFSADVFESIFNSFTTMLSAKSAIDKTNPWRENLGSAVISDKLTFIDDPFFTQGFSNCPFDSEGFSKRENILLENGILKQFIHNSATASELGLDNNFCASRSSKSTLGSSFSNFIISTGDDTDLNRTEHIEIIKAQGLHSGTSPISGDFSLGVSGRIWKDGEIVKYFKDVTISGNFYNMLKEVNQVGNELLSTSSMTFFSPKIIFNKLSIAGN